MENQKKNQAIIDSYDYLANAASAMDCTGLIPTPPMSQAEVDSYNDVYQFEPPSVAISPSLETLLQKKTDL